MDAASLMVPVRLAVEIALLDSKPMLSIDWLLR